LEVQSDMEQNSTETALTQDNQTLIECPRCGFQKVINVAKFFKRSNAGNFVSKCKCGYTSNVVMERRKFERHFFDAKGSVLRERIKGKPESSGITVKDLSRSGVKFDTEKNEVLETDENIIITFEFSDNRKTFFIKEATVRNVKGKTIRAEFKTLCGDIALLMHTEP
jgi:predicted RNA-binding Zn-ribbon protein involved in translation (DUF1610 family)